jgi:hypothetical protein
MHVKKYVCDATCGTLLQEKSKGKDHKNAREDLKDLGIRPELFEKKILCQRQRQKNYVSFCMI